MGCSVIPSVGCAKFDSPESASFSSPEKRDYRNVAQTFPDTKKTVSEETYREVAGFRGIISKKTAEEIWVGTIKFSYFDPKINFC